MAGITRSPSNVMSASKVCLHPMQPLEDCIGAELVLFQLVFSKAFKHNSPLSSKDSCETFKEKGGRNGLLRLALHGWRGRCCQTGLKLLNSQGHSGLI